MLKFSRDFLSVMNTVHVQNYVNWNINRCAIILEVRHNIRLSKYKKKMFGDQSIFLFDIVVRLFQQQYRMLARIIIEKQQNGGQFAKTLPYDFVRRVTDSMSMA